MVGGDALNGSGDDLARFGIALFARFCGDLTDDARGIDARIVAYLFEQYLFGFVLRGPRGTPDKSALIGEGAWLWASASTCLASSSSRKMFWFIRRSLP